MPATTAPEGTKKLRVLIVDDDPSMLILLPKVLKRKGFDVAVAEDADVAEQVLEKARFDVVILDVQMPGRDGFSLVGAIRRRWPEVKIIFVSAYDSDPMRKRAALMGVEAFLAKPVGVEELLHHLRKPEAENG